MCLILFAWRVRSDLPFIVAANRDEFFARPTTPAAYWAEQPTVLAGRDLSGGGTWLGVVPAGRFAAITNFRDGKVTRKGKRSRGLLVTDFLLSADTPRQFLSELDSTSGDYDGFNLLVGSADELYHYSNRGGPPLAVEPGVHGLSNHLLNTPWPKVQQGKEAVQGLLDAPREGLIAGLFDMLENRAPARDDDLPDTGVGLVWERALSAPFIAMADYGTRASTVLLVDHMGEMTFWERTFNPEGTACEQRIFTVTQLSNSSKGCAA